MKDPLSIVTGERPDGRALSLKEGTPISHKAQKGLKQRGRDHCEAQTKAGGPFRAPAND